MQGINKALANDIVEAIIEDLSDRNGLRQGWDEIDDDIQEEIMAEWTNIVMNISKL